MGWKSDSSSKIKKIIEREGRKVIVFFPTVIPATLTDRGTTNHHNFQSKTDDVT